MYNKLTIFLDKSQNYSSIIFSEYNKRLFKITEYIKTVYKPQETVSWEKNTGGKLNLQGGTGNFMGSRTGYFILYELAVV